MRLQPKNSALPPKTTSFPWSPLPTLPRLPPMAPTGLRKMKTVFKQRKSYSYTIRAARRGTRKTVVGFLPFLWMWSFQKYFGKKIKLNMVNRNNKSLNIVRGSKNFAGTGKKLLSWRFFLLLLESIVVE